MGASDHRDQSPFLSVIPYSLSKMEGEGLTGAEGALPDSPSSSVLTVLLQDPAVFQVGAPEEF